MNRKTKEINIFNQKKRKILCIANEHDYLGDGRIIHEKNLLVGKQYTFTKGEVKSYGSMVYLEELPSRYGYQSYLFEELRPYDVEEYKEVEPNSRKSVLAKLGHMKGLCKERDNLYEKQNDLKGKKQKIEESLER